MSLGLTCVAAAIVGLPASLAPRAFYDHFPFVAHWVDRLPPFNEHLITDVGGLYLALAVILGWAAWTLQRDLVRAACAGWLVAAPLHLMFHAGHLSGYSTADAIGQTVALSVYVLLPVIALWAVSAPSPGRPTPPDRERLP